MEHRFYTKNIRSAILGLLNIIMVCCLTAVLVLNFATSAPQSVYADENAAFSNIVNANIGLHPKWELDKCDTVDEGGVGDTYTSAHRIWRVTTDETNDPVLEKSPSYVFTGDETNAAELAKEYNLKKGNNVVFNITEEDTAAKVWADAIAFAQSIGTETALVGDDLASCKGDDTSAQNETHNGWRVGSNIGKRNHFKGNFFLDNSDGSIGQYITVRLQTDWTAKNVTAKIPQTVHKVTDNSKGDYIEISGDTQDLETTTFNYIKTALQSANDGYLQTSTNYLDSLGDKSDFNAVTDFNRISTSDGYTLSYDLASNGFDYDVSNFPSTAEKDERARKSGNALNVFNDICAFSFGRLHIPTGVYIVLDLNGHTIDRNLAGEGKGDYYGSVISVSNVARLEVMDSTAYENASAARIEEKDGAYTTNHKGTITGGHIKAQDNNVDGEYSRNAAFPADMRLKFHYMGAAVNLAPWADFVMDSGTVQGNETEGPNDGGSHGGSGGAFYQRSKAAVTIYDGYVIDNEASNKGGVTILGDGSGCAFTMYGGVLANNKAGALGGAVQLGTSTYANFHGGEIVNNTAGRRGGAINLFANTLGILDSVTITGNKVTADATTDRDSGHLNGHGGAIYVDEATRSIDEYRIAHGFGPGFRFRGSLQIYGNTCGSSNKEENVYLSQSYSETKVSGSGIPSGCSLVIGFAQIAIDGSMFANGIAARVGVTLGQYGTETDNVFTSGYGKNGNSGVNTFLYFSSDNSDYAVVNNEDSTAREATLGQASSVNNDGGLTWVIEGTGTDADTDMSEGKGESTIKIVIPSEGDPDFYYKNPNNNHGLTTLQKVDGNSQMNKQVKLTTTPKEEDGTDKLLEVLKDRFTISNGSLTFEYSMLKVTKISVYTGTPSFSASGDNLNASGSTPLRTWESKQTADGDKPTYKVTNTFENANFRFKLGTKDLTATKDNVSGMQDAISATDGSISYAGEYSVLVSDGENRYNNPTFKIRINQVGVEVGRTLYYNGQKIGKGEALEWTKDWIDWNGDKVRDNGSDVTKPNEIDQPYFVYSGDYYYPILNADYNSLQVFRLYNPYATEGDGYSSVAKSAFTGYVLDFTYANEYFGTKQPVQFGSHSGGGIQYQTMHRKPNSIAGTGTYVPGVKNAGMYEVTFISSRSAASADENDEDFKATGVYFAANNFAFSSKINIYVDPASAEVELTNEAKNDFTFNGRAFSDTEIVSYDNTSNTHVNPHFDTSAYLEYYEFSDLSLKAGIYDVRTKLYYTLDQIKNWKDVRPYGSLDGVDDLEREKQAAAAGRPYISSYKDSELETPPVVLWDSKTNKHFDPSNPGEHITDGILDDNGLAAFEKLYERPVDLTSTGKLVYIVDSSSFKKATKLEGNPTNARRYAVFVTLDLDVGYDDYNYNFDQNADHLMGLDKDTSYFWAFEFTVNPAQIVPYDYDMSAGDRPDGANTSVQIEKKHIYNGVSFGYDYLGSGKDGYTYYNDGDTGNNLYKDENSRLLIKGTFEGTDCYYSISPDDGSGVVQLHKHTTEKPYTVDVNATYTLKGGRFVDDGNSDVTDKIVLTVTDQQVLPTIVYTSEGQQVTLLKDVDYVVYYTAADLVNASVKYVNHGGSWTMETENTLPVTVYFGGSNRNYAYADDNGAMPFSVNFRIEPVIVTASASLSYAYDGSDWGRARYLPPRGDRGAWYESIFFLVQDDITTPQELIEHQHDYGYSYEYPSAPKNERSLEDLWGGVQTRNDIYYGDTDFYKGRYTLGGITVSYNDTGFIANGLQFGLGVYSFKTGNANATSMPYHLTPVALDGKQKDVGDAPTETGVTWILTFGNTQYFNTGRDFVINMAESSLDVTITQKDINDNFGSITRFGDKTFDHVSKAGGGDKLTSSATRAVYPYAGDGWGYFPAVTFKYVPSFEVKTAESAPETKYYDFGGYYKGDLGGPELKSNVLKTVQAGKEGSGGFDGLTLTYSNNTSATDSAAVRVIGSGNYTGTFILNFTIDPAKIKATYSKEEQPVFDKQTHAVGVTYSNVSSFGRGEGFAAYEVLNTNTEYGEDNKAILRKISDTATVSQYTENDVPLPGSAITVEYRASKEVYKVEEGWDTDAPVNAKTYDVRITVANSNYAFVDSDNFKRDSEYDGIEQTDTIVYGTHTILPAEVTVEVTNTGSKYTGEQQSAALSFANKLYSSGNSAYQFVVPEPSGYTITRYYLDGTGVYGGDYDSEEAPVHVGNYTITIQLTPTSVSVGGGSYTFNNYCFTLEHSGNDPTFTAGTTTNKEFNITKAEILLGDLVSASYNGNAQQPALTFENSERGNDEIPVNGGSEIGNETFYTVEYTPGETGADNMKTGDEYFITGGKKVPCYADTYNVVVTLVNYGARDFMFIGHSGDSKGQEITDDGKIIKDDFIITPALVLVTVEGDVSITYDAQSHKCGVNFAPQTADGVSPQAADYEIIYKYNGWSSENIDKEISEREDFKNAGKYSLTVKLTENGNFAFRQTGVGTYLYEDNSLSYRILAKNLNDMTLPEVGGTATDESMGKVVKLLKDYKFVMQDEDVTIKTASGGEVIFTGSAIEPVSGVLGLEKDGDGSRKELERGTDYTISYVEQINAGNAVVKITGGSHNYNGIIEIDYTISPKSLGNATYVKDGDGGVTFMGDSLDNDNEIEETSIDSIRDKTYTGNPRAFAPSLLYKPATAIQVTLSENVDVGHFFCKQDGGKWVQADTILGAGNYRAVVFALEKGKNNEGSAGNGSGNYTGNFVYDFEVTPAGLTVFLEGQDTVYDGIHHQFNVRFSSTHAAPTAYDFATAENEKIEQGKGVYEFKEYTLVYGYSSDFFSEKTLLFINVGTYTVKVYIKSSNFTWEKDQVTGSDDRGSYVELSYAITPVEITASAATSTFTFGNVARQSDVSFTNEINAQVPTVPPRILLDGQTKYENKEYTLVFDGGRLDGGAEPFDGYVSNWFDGHDGFKNVGDYIVKVVLPEGGNFIFGGDSYETTYTYRITPAVLSIDPISATVYNGANQEPELQFSVVGEDIDGYESLLIKDETYQISISAANRYGVNDKFNYANDDKPKNADVYTLTVKLGHIAGGKFVQDESKAGNFVFVDLTSSGTTSTMKAEYIINPFDFTQNPDSRITMTGLDEKGYTFTGSSISPEVTLTDTVVAKVDKDGRMSAGTDYIAAYYNNVNAAANDDANAPTITFTGQGNYTGVRSLKFTIVAVSLGTNKRNAEGENYSFTYTDAHGQQNQHVTSEANGNDSELFGYEQLKSSYVYSASVRPATFTLFYNPAKGSDGIAPPSQSLVNGFEYVLSYYVFLKEESGKEIWKEIGADDIKDVGRYLLFLNADNYEGAANKNYSGAYIIGFEITPAKVTVTFDGAQTDEKGKLSFVYDGQPHNNTLVFLSCEDGEGGATPVSSDYRTDTEYDGTTYSFDNSHNNSYVGAYKVIVYFVQGANGSVNFEWDTGYASWNGELKQLKPEFEDENTKATLSFEIVPLEVEVRLDDSNTYYYTGASRDAGVEFPEDAVHPGNGDYRLEYYSAEEGQSETLEAIDAREYKVKFILTNKNFKLKKRENTGEESAADYYKFITDESGRNFVIKPAEISASLKNSTVEYDGTGHTVKALFSNLVGSDKVPYPADYKITFRKGAEGDYGENELINAGVYSVKVTLLSTNYKFRIAEETLQDDYILEYIVTPKIISASLSSHQRFYDGKAHTPTTLFNILFAKGEESVELISGSDYSLEYYKGLVDKTSSVTEFQAAATYIVRVELTSGGNYAFSSLGDNRYVYINDLNYLIDARAFDTNTTVEVTFDKTDTFVYTGSPIEPKVVSVKVTFNSNEPESSETIVLAADEYNVAYNDNTNAGYAKIIVYGMNNYSGTVESEFTIRPKSLSDSDEVEEIKTGTVSGSILDETYMGVAFNITPNISYTPKLFTYGAEGNITWWDGDTVILSNADFKLDKYQIQSGTEWNEVDTVLNAGNYKAVYSGAGANYTDTIEIEFTIKTALLYAELTSFSLDYTGGEHRLSDFIAFYNASDTNVTPATSTGNRYTVYTGEESVVSVINANTYTVTVKVEGNNFKWVTESDKKYRDGTLLNVTTDENGNAVFTFTVNKAKVGVTLSSKHANIYDGNNHKRYLSVSFANNINPTTVPNERDYDITWSNEGVFTDAGRYTVNIKLNSSDFCWYAQRGEDYDWGSSVVKDDTVTVVYTIEQAHLSASFNPDFTEYSGKAVKLADNLKLFNASGTTVIPSKSEYKVYSGDEATTTVTDAGEYIVTIKLNDNSNYIFDAASNVSDSINITFTVRPMIINLDPFASQTYDGQTHEAQVSFVNQNGYRQEIDGYTVSYEITGSANNNASLYKDKPLNAGRYTVKVTLNYEGDFGNWAFTQENSGGVMRYTYETSGLFEIVKRDVTITVGDGHSVYGKTLPDVASWGFKAEGLVTGAVIDNNDTKESLDIKLSYSPTIYPLTVAGEYSQSIFATAGVNTNPNYSIREINYGTFTMYARKVEIQILNGSSVYGTYRKGDVLPLVKDTHWRYTDVDNVEYFDILENDMSHLAFYLATCEPETKYAPVGTYDIVGTWGKDVTEGAAALKNYEITFVKGNGGAAGKFTVDPADIVSNQLADWNPAAKPFRNGEVGRYAMNFPVAEYIKLVGDYVLRTGDDNGYYTRMDFDGYYEEGETAYFKFVAFRGFYNEDDEGVVIKLYKPEFTGEAENASGYLADTANGVWKVYNVGEWKMKVEITQSNHNPLTCYLTYNIVPVDALVVLNPIIAPLTLEYGLEYLFPENPDGSFSQAQIAELLEIELNLKLFDYIFSSDNWMYSTVLSITGLDPLVGRDNMQGAYELLKANTRIEVTPATDGAGNFINYLSTSGRLNAGIYDIRIVAVEGCGFTAAFAAGGSNTGRLAITPHKLSVKWAEDEFEADGTQIVKVENGRIYYIYTGNGYSQSPAFDGIFSTDGVSDLIDTPAYEIRLPDGTAIENPRNVLELDGNYIVYVYDILEGKDSDNYRLPDVLQTYLQIVPRDITVTILDDTSIYGDCTDADIAAKLVEVERYTDISWLGAGDTVDSLNITLNKREGLNAGDYEITAKYDNINYNVTFVNGTYTVVPRPVTVTIGDVETTFGDEEPDLLKNYTAVGVIEGDTLKLRFEILGATYYDNYINGNLMGHYLEVCDDPAGYAIEGVDLDPNYDITFAGGRDGERASYVVHKAQNGWSQWFLFDYIIEGNLPFPLDLPIAYFGPTLVEYYYDEEMTQRIEAPLSELETGTYYARACVEETKNFTGLPFGNHTFEIVTGFLPRDRDFNILPLTILLAVEVAALVYGLIFVRRRKK